MEAPFWYPSVGQNGHGGRKVKETSVIERKKERKKKREKARAQ